MSNIPSFDPPLTAREQELWDQAFIQRAANPAVAADVADNAIRERRKVLEERAAGRVPLPGRGPLSEIARFNRALEAELATIERIEALAAGKTVGEVRRAAQEFEALISRLHSVMSPSGVRGRGKTTAQTVSENREVLKERAADQLDSYRIGLGLDLTREAKIEAAARGDFGSARAEGMEPPERDAKRGWHTNPLWPDWLPRKLPQNYKLPEKWVFVVDYPREGELTFECGRWIVSKSTWPRFSRLLVREVNT